MATVDGEFRRAERSARASRGIVVARGIDLEICRARVLDSIRVCQWGTSNAANYGDQLFPLIAKEQMTTRVPGLEMACYAPGGDATLLPGSPPLFPLVPGGGSLDRKRLKYFAGHFDAVLIGGGDLLRFDRSEPGYGDSEHEGPRRPYDAFLDFSCVPTPIAT